ncbi:MAG: N-glycosylase/DNA lyase [Nanoarchaeota archaeon]
MKTLVAEALQLSRGAVGEKVRAKMAAFDALRNAGNEEWYSELCFCVLAANSKSRTSRAIQEELGYAGFSSAPFETVRDTILSNKHRFHNNKARFIVANRAHLRIKDEVTPLLGDLTAARAWLARNIVGFGYKEASHFLRNVGYGDLAVLDRHILFLMHEHGMLDAIPKSMTPRQYLLIEKDFLALAKKAKMRAGEFDFYLWYMRAGDVIK